MKRSNVIQFMLLAILIFKKFVSFFSKSQSYPFLFLNHLCRPRSSRFYPSKGKTEPSLYETEYQWKKALEKRNSSHRPGSSSGQRKNKPHPLEVSHFLHYFVLAKLIK